MIKKKRHQIARGQSLSLSGHQLTAFLRCFIAGSLADGEPTIARAAVAANIHVRTLQRRLTDAGATYHQLVNEVRLETALLLLVRSEKSVADIARALGYSHPGHFTRAFRSWTGETPSAIRKRLRKGCRRRSCSNLTG